MDWLNDLRNDKLLETFRRNKTIIANMEKPRTFLNLLKDYDFVPEEECKRVIDMEGEGKQEAIYEILEKVEKNPASNIRQFWKCVFEEVIRQQYPAIENLYKRLLDDISESGQTSSAMMETERQQEQPGPSSGVSPRKMAKSEERPPSASMEKQDVWRKTWLPVTCGEKTGTFYKSKLLRGEPCINDGGHWFTTNEFEIYGGKGSTKNWKQTIQCMGTPLGRLIKLGFLKVKRRKQHK